MRELLADMVTLIFAGSVWYVLWVLAFCVKTFDLGVTTEIRGDIMSISIIKRIKTARSMFVAADWRHVYRGVDSSLVDESYCEGDVDGCQYCVAVQTSVQAALILSEQAIEACKNNDWRQAEDLIQQCVSIESEWGDAPAYGPVAQAMKTL